MLMGLIEVNLFALVWRRVTVREGNQVHLSPTISQKSPDHSKFCCGQVQPCESLF